MKKSLALGITLLSVLVITAVVLTQSPNSSYQDTPQDRFQMASMEESIAPKAYGFSLDSLSIVKSAFKTNQNLAEILLEYNVPVSMITKLGSVPKDLFDVRRLRADKPYTIIHNQDSTAKGFVYHPNPIDYVVLEFEDSLKVYRGQHPVDTQYHAIEGIIENSLYTSLIDAGGSPELANLLSDIYAWDIDFFGLQKGDTYRMIYTTHHVNDSLAGIGEILAAKFTHMGNPYYAFGYDQGIGVEYFDEEGNSRRKAFLKAPLRFSRISSGFSYSRLHPVLKIRRPHYGVDYAAPTGTPVYAIGAGIVMKRAYSGGAGNMIKIKHNGNYTSGYLHLSRYAKGIHVGKKVEQGDLIGYVGSTGLSTGPHLDFRFWKNGSPVNPLRISAPSTGPICASLKDDYLIHKELLMIELESNENYLLAKEGVDKEAKEETNGIENIQSSETGQAAAI